MKFQEYLNESLSKSGSPDYQKLHKLLVKEIGNIKGITEFKDYFENPNKYNETISDFTFKFDVEDKFNYSKANIKYTHDDSKLFIPDFGYKIIGGNDKKKTKDIITHIKKWYKLK